ncbi:sensor histidine kinase [Aeromicrobium sp.]|uniref:sensor histidine kinase n=1 Tax=Aeromicrobium sp. TaxID=1871063 RepID=UPI003D6AF5E3
MPGPPTRFYLRIVFVLIGAALALALGLLDATLIAAMVQGTPLPIWAVSFFGAVFVVAPIVALGLVPAMRTIEGVAVQTLLMIDLPGGAPGPAGSWPQRRRTLDWFAVHLASGAVLVAGVMATIAFASVWVIVPLLVGLVALAVGLGELLARAAPSMLGPAAAERVAVLENDVERAVARNRIAGEIHDSVGHALSLVSVQAGAARKVIAHNPEFAEAALKAIETAARDAAADLDHVLGLLREDVTPAEAPPAPDLDSLEQLVRATCAAGLAVDHDVHGDITTVSSLVSREAYRIVQEALTNALKYSTDGTARLVVTRSAAALTVTLVNRSKDQWSGRPAGTGRGLRGMTERVQALGGSFSSASVAPDAWMLSATLPLTAGRQ